MTEINYETLSSQWVAELDKLSKETQKKLINLTLTAISDSDEPKISGAKIAVNLYILTMELCSKVQKQIIVQDWDMLAEEVLKKRDHQ